MNMAQIIREGRAIAERLATSGDISLSHEEAKTLGAYHKAQSAEIMRLRRKLMGEHAPAEQKWERYDGPTGVLLYTLKQDGWRRGEPQMVNDITIRIENGSRSAHDLRGLADLIQAFLNEGEK